MLGDLIGWPHDHSLPVASYALVVCLRPFAAVFQRLVHLLAQVGEFAEVRRLHAVVTRDAKAVSKDSRDENQVAWLGIVVLAPFSDLEPVIFKVDPSVQELFGK